MKIYLPFLLCILLLSCSQCSTREHYVAKNDTTSARSYTVEVFAKDLTIPWSIVFTDATRMLFVERDGKLREITGSTLNPKPLHVFTNTWQDGEAGLMGLALDPSYRTNKFIYISYAYEKDDNMFVRIVRYTDQSTSISDPKIILDNIPAASNHAGCRLRFGPDGKLYITTGDATEKKLAQNKNSLSGKILRINADGSVPSDNPYPGNPVWTYGHRNPQGIDWYPGTSILYSTEHGPSTFDGKGGGDEVNIIEKGKNYGWPVVSHDKSQPGMESPVLEFTPAIAPASGMFYHSDSIASFKNNFFFGCLRGNGIMRVVVDPANPKKVLSHELMSDIDFGRIREIAEGPDGAIYFSTSNKDGRGSPGDGDDKIYRIRRK
jgi:glucose/arabinose dehydrogenase